MGGGASRRDRFHAVQSGKLFWSVRAEQQSARALPVRWAGSGHLQDVAKSRRCKGSITTATRKLALE